MNTTLIRNSFLSAIIVFVTLFFSGSICAATKTSAATGSWSAPATWSPSGVPASGDDVIIASGHVVTVDGAYTCNNLNLGNATATNTTLQITSAANSLTINGDLQINPSNKANTFILNAGPGTLNIAGTLSTWSSTGTNSIRASTGSVNFTPAITLDNANKNITLIGAGTINFNSSFTDQYNKLVTFAGSTINFAASYSVNTTAAVWVATAQANFTGNGSITPSTSITFGPVQINATATTTLNSGAGTVIIAGNFTLASGSVFTANMNFEVGGNWTNNGSTLNLDSYTVTLNSAAGTIGGTTSTTFPTLQIGRTGGATAAAITMNTNTICNYLVLNSSTVARSLTLGAVTFTVNNDVTINQPGAAVTNALNVNAGNCNVTGNLTFVGATATATWVGKVAVTTGTFSVNGTVTWMSNTAVATEVITVTTGTVTFGSSLTMGSNSGTLSVTSTGTINFNGASAPSFTFGGVVTVPVFTTTNGCTLNFANGFTNNTNALTLAATSQTNFTGNGTITPNAAITFGHAQINTSVAETLASGAGTVIVAGNFTLASSSTFTTNMNFEVTGNWTNNGGTLSGGSNTVTLNGAAGTIGGTSSTTFPTLQIGRTGGATAVAITMNTNTTCNYLVFNSSTVARTLTLGGVTFTVNNDVTLNQPGAAVTNALNVNAGTCNVTGNLTFVGATATATWVAKVAVTTGTFAVNGTVTWMSNTAVATEVITVTTGTLTFGSSLTMGSNSGTLSVTSTGTINFNGAFDFGGVATVPVFTTTNGCTINFANNFTNRTNALIFAAASQTNFTSDGTITPNAAITFGHAQVNASVSETLALGAGAVIIAGNLTLAAGSTFTDNDDFEVTGNWTNNGGTFVGGSSTVTLNGASGTIGGTSSTTFATLQIGRTGGATAAAITMNTNSICNYLVFNSSTVARTLTLGAVTFTVNNDVTINQPGAAVTNALNVNAGTCNVTGNLTFVGAIATATWVAKVAVTSGTFDLAGTVTWMSNTAVATEVITLTTGTVTFDSPITMGSSSGTLSVTSTGTINFNGAFTFGGVATFPVFTTTNGCTVNFAGNFTNNTNALTLAATSQTNFIGGGTITPNAAITFGHVQINASVSETLASGAGAVIIAGNVILSSGSTFTANMSFEAGGNWTNNGGSLIGGANTITLNSAAGTIDGSSATSFPILQIGRTGGATAVSYTMNGSSTCNYLNFNAAAVARTLTLGSGVTFTVNNDVTINQPTANAITNSLAVNAGTCNVSGNLIFTGVNNTVTRIAQIAVTSGTFALTGSVTWMVGNTAVATEVITVSTGTVTFGSSLTMGTGSGTLSVTSTGTINFNGASSPSFAFGGAATIPVFNTTNGCTLSFNNGFTNNTNALTLAATSNSIFSGTGTITPSAAITFGHIQINSGKTVTLAGNISLAGNWTNNGGTFTPGTNTVTFSGTGIQNITKTGGETFYKIVGTNAAATVTLVNDITITNNLTMTAANFNLNGNTLTLGSSAGASLTYTAGIAYGGTWKRWFPASAITSNSGSYYGLFPTGTSTDYRPIAINSTVSPSTAGYVSASHTDAATVTLVTYTDNESNSIQVISDKKSILSTSGLAGGTYNLDVSLTALGSTGVTTDMKLETYTSSTMGSVGTSAATSGTVSSPTIKRTSLSAANLSNTWVLGSKSKTSTPFRNYYYSRKSGNWNDVTPGNGTWSYTSGGSGASCDCTPVSDAYVIISANQTVTVNSNATVDYVDINTGATLTDNGTNTLTINRDITTYGTGSFVNTSSWTITGTVSLSSGSASSTTGTLTLSGNVELGGTLALNTANLNLGTGSTLSGSGTITTTGGSVITAATSKTIASGSDLTFGSITNPITFNINGPITLTNNGTVKIYGDLTGTTSGSTWTNATGSSLEVTGTLLGTGTLDASASSNTVIFSGSAAQTIKIPSSTYSNLTVNNAAGVSTSETTLIAGELALTNGVINTTSSNPLKLTSTGSYSGGSASSYVNGPMAKVGNTSFIFPVGKAGKLMRVGVSGMSTATTEITAEYFSTPYSDTTNLSAELTQVSPVEYWDVNRTVTSDPIKLRFYWENAIESHMLNCNYLTIAHYKSGQWQKEPATVVSGICNGDGSGSIETSGYVSTFSPFGFGSSGGEALPIKLVSFNAIPQGNIVETQWSTELEINNAYFTVERSIDGNNFSEVNRVEGAGNSTSLLQYNAIDENPLRGISYYRLRQTDFDGQYSYSNIVAVTIGEQTGYKLFPNPAKGEFFVNVSNPSSEIQLNIYDMVGRKIYAKTIEATKGITNQTVSVATKNLLTPGVYLVSTSTNGTEFKERVVVN